MYLTFDEYVNMGGTLEEQAYTLYEYEAEYLINWYTFNRLKNSTINDDVKRCVFVLVNFIAKKNKLMDSSVPETDNTDSRPILSQSNDGVAVTYVSTPATDLITLCNNELAHIVNLYLQDVTDDLGRKVLYRGLYPNE